MAAHVPPIWAVRPDVPWQRPVPAGPTGPPPPRWRHGRPPQGGRALAAGAGDEKSRAESEAPRQRHRAGSRRLRGVTCPSFWTWRSGPRRRTASLWGTEQEAGLERRGAPCPRSCAARHTDDGHLISLFGIGPAHLHRGRLPSPCAWIGGHLPFRDSWRVIKSFCMSISASRSRTGERTGISTSAGETGEPSGSGCCCGGAWCCSGRRPQCWTAAGPAGTAG